jgi:glutathione S-transferase
VAYAYHEHVPMIGEPLLRRAARKGGLEGKASVPLLVGEGETAMGSTPIAELAERVGRGATLFPGGAREAVARWDALAQRMMDVARAWLLRNLASDRAVQKESLPKFFPGPLRGAAAMSAGLAAAFLQKKYDAPTGTALDAAVSDVLRPALVDVRAVLSGRPYLEGAFSWADICVATALQGLRPHPRIVMGAATSGAWSNEALAREFEDLLMWRDALYAEHRGGSPTKATP